MDEDIITPDRSQQPGDASTPNLGLRYVNGTELFSVIVHQASPVAPVIYVAGEIDLLTAPSFQDHLSKLLAHRPECIVIDLSQVSFMGATGLSVLLYARHTGAQQGATLKLRNPRRSAARTLTLLGLDRLFEVLPPAAEQT